MADSEETKTREAALSAVAALGAPTLAVLDGLEHVARHLHPPEIPRLRADLMPHVERLTNVLTQFEAEHSQGDWAPLVRPLRASAELAVSAGRDFCLDGAPESAIQRVLGAMRTHAQALAELFPLAESLPPIHRFFSEPAVRERRPLPAAAPDDGRRFGLFSGGPRAPERGGFVLYVPARCDPEIAAPLVVALHGGSGHGTEFLWTWVREARTRGFLLLAPTSRGSTWSLGPVDADGDALRSMVDYVCGQWNVDRERVLLTGLSDGATYTLLHGLAADVPYTALAPISGVFHPQNAVNGNLERARDRRIHLVHGALDWMFPVAMAREAAEQLSAVGARLTYSEIPDLSHAYPREHNAALLDDVGIPVDAPLDGPPPRSGADAPDE